MTTTPSRKRRPRRFLQFSLRSLLVFVLLVSVGMSWLGVKLERARRQREAVRVIEGLGGWVLYDTHFVYDAEGSDITIDVPSKLETRLQLATGAFFSDVTVARCRGFGDRHLLYLKTFPNLELLEVSGTEITDRGLMCLTSLSRLGYVNVKDTRVTPEGVKKLQEALPDCEILY